MIEQTDEDLREEAIARRRQLPYSDQKRRKRLHRLIQADCDLNQIAKDLGCTPGNVRTLIMKNGFSRLWLENRERRASRRRRDPAMVRRRMRVAGPVLDEFKARGYHVVIGRFVDQCRIEGFPISVFLPKRVRERKSRYATTRYFSIMSRYLDRFLIIVLPNGKKVFRWPRKLGTKWLYIPEWELLTPEEFPSKAEFRRQRALINAQQGRFQRKKPPTPQQQRENEDIWRLLGFEEHEIPKE